VLDATIGHDPADPMTVAGTGKTPASYRAALRPDALRGARIGVLSEFFGTAPEDQPVAAVVRKAVDDMKAQGAIAVDVTLPNLTTLLAASNLLVQELKFDLREYFGRPPTAVVRSVEALLASGLHAAQLQGFLEGANALADDYPASDEYRKRLEGRDTLRSVIIETMDANRIEALVYPTARRIAPVIGGNQLGSNAGLSAQSGCPAITVPAGVVEGGFPVGVELLGRPFAEPVLLALAFAYEQATRHRRPPASAPKAPARQARRDPTSGAAGSGRVRIDVEATGPFRVSARLAVDEQARQIFYTLTPRRARDGIAGVYLHRRANRPNGGVAHVLAKRLDRRMSGTVTLLEPELADLKLGKCYIAAVSSRNPLIAARADLVWPG
jgi:amidase